MRIVVFELLKIFKRKIFLCALLFGFTTNILLLFKSLKIYNSSSNVSHYDLGWKILFSNLGLWYLIGFIIIVGISPIFTEEYSTGVDSLLLCSKLGRNSLVTSKITASLLFILILAAAFILMDLSFYHYNFYLPDSNAPIQSLLMFQGSPYNLTIVQMLLIISVIKLGGCMAFGLLVLFVSARTKSIILSFFINGSVLYIPFVLPIDQSSFFYFIKEFNFEKLMSVNEFFYINRTFNVFSHNIHYFNVALFIAVFLSAIIVLLTYKSYVNHQIYKVVDEL